MDDRLRGGVAGLALIATAVGCGAVSSVRVLRQDRNGGELRVAGPYYERAADAQLVMAEGCDGPFAVLAGEHDAPRLLRAPEPAQRRFQYVCLPPRGSPEAHAMDGTR